MIEAVPDLSNVVSLWGDLRPAYVAPNTLAWEFDDTATGCRTTYVVYVNEAMPAPRIRCTFWDGEVMDIPTTDPHDYGTWATPREFAEWARRYAAETPLGDTAA